MAKTVARVHTCNLTNKTNSINKKGKNKHWQERKIILQCT